MPSCKVFSKDVLLCKQCNMQYSSLLPEVRQMCAFKNHLNIHSLNNYTLVIKYTLNIP